ncbi:MAG TPA: MlaD family protein [Thermoanaerobaculia bacterium]|jgi:phospholipid/cholesterol/gamma-HCH transport system substrate-binding protein|nr:MlaD family protein [Thermoanaerobaculia bacterium]
MSAVAKVGLFFLVALVLAGILIFKIEDLRLGKKSGKSVSIVFKDVSGLDNKATVRVAGVRVGKVTKIKLIEGRAYVQVELDSDVDLRQGASAAIGNLGLLGEKYLELIPGPIGAPPLPEDSVLTGNQAVSFDQVTKLAHDIELDVKDITASLRNALGGPEGEQTTRAIVDNIERITEELKVIVATNHENVDATLANFREFSHEMTRLADRIDALVAANSTNTTATISNIKEISDKLQHTADNLNAITDKVNTGKGTVGQLINSDETSRNLNDALVSVKEGVGTLNKTLGRAAKIKIDLGVRAEYLSQPSKSKGYLTADIIPDEDHFYRLELATQPFGRRSLSTTNFTTTFPDGHQETTTIQKEKFDDANAVSALFGFNFGDLTLRAGLEESRGGGGIDYSLLHKRLRFSFDAWDFARQDYNAHMKIGGRWYFSPSIYATAGWDDFLNRTKKADSLFFGAGVRWSDEDLKLLLGSVPLK